MKPGKKCSICSSVKRLDADNMLAAGSTLGEIVKATGLTKSSLARHAKVCVPRAIAQVREFVPAAREKIEAFELVSKVEELQGITREIMLGAMAGVPVKDKAGNVHVLRDGELALKAIAQARRNLELIGRLTGTLEPKDNSGPKLVTWTEFEAIYVRARQGELL